MFIGVTIAPRLTIYSISPSPIRCNTGTQSLRGLGFNLRLGKHTWRRGHPPQGVRQINRSRGAKTLGDQISQLVIHTTRSPTRSSLSPLHRAKGPTGRAGFTGGRVCRGLLVLGLFLRRFVLLRFCSSVGLFFAVSRQWRFFVSPKLRFTLPPCDVGMARIPLAPSANNTTIALRVE